MTTQTFLLQIIAILVLVLVALLVEFIKRGKKLNLYRRIDAKAQVALAKIAVMYQGTRLPVDAIFYVVMFQHAAQEALIDISDTVEEEEKPWMNPS